MRPASQEVGIGVKHKDAQVRTRTRHPEEGEMEQMHTRSSFLKLGGALLGAAALPGVALGAPNRLASSLFADATTLKLANDKVTWKPWFNTAGEAAAKAIGIGWDAVEYADTTSYQAAIRTSGPHRRRCRTSTRGGRAG